MLRVNAHGGEYVVRRIPTGVDKVCERDGDIDCTDIFREGGDPNLWHSSKIFTKIHTIQVHDDVYDSRNWILNCPGRILLISN